MENTIAISAATPRGLVAGKIAEHHRQQNTADKNSSSRGPILSTDFIKTAGPALQPGDLFIKLAQTSHAHLVLSTDYTDVFQ